MIMKKVTKYATFTHEEYELVDAWCGILNLKGKILHEALKEKELNRTKAEIEKLKREKNEIKEAVEAESQKRLNEILLTEKERIRKGEEDKNELRFKEMQMQLEAQIKLTKEMKRKQEQGSMQMQGEVQ